MRVRNFLFEKGILSTYHSTTKIISVGNISTGGTGKTPVSAYLTDYYLAIADNKPAYLSRGYGRKSKGLQIVKKEGDSREYGDEALMIANKYPEIPVVVCEERKIGIQFLEDKANVIILDDAFQHRKVARSIDLLVIDANRLPVDDFILPAGNLREPISGINRANFFIISKIKKQSQIEEIKKKLTQFGKEMAFCSPILTNVLFFFQTESFTHSELKDKSIWLFSGIGNPQAFEDSVTKIGSNIENHIIFPDHYSYKEEDFEKMRKLWEKADEEPEFIITTEKDYFRLKSQTWLEDFSDLPLAYIQMELKWWEGEEKLIQLLKS